MTALTSTRNDMVVVPIRSELGLRLGYNVGYPNSRQALPGTRSDKWKLSHYDGDGEGGSPGVHATRAFALAFLFGACCLGTFRPVYAQLVLGVSINKVPPPLPVMISHRFLLRVICGCRDIGRGAKALATTGYRVLGYCRPRQVYCGRRDIGGRTPATKPPPPTKIKCPPGERRC